MGADDFEQAGKVFDEARRKLLGAPRADDDAELQRLADLSPIKYDRVRKEEAARLRVKVSTLDQQVEARRPSFPVRQKGEPLNGQGRSLTLPDVKPWLEPVDGAGLLADLVAAVRRHVILPSHAADAVALWAVWAWLIVHFDIAPRLAVLSPEKRCGKSTLLEILFCLTPRPLLVSGITAAAIFRTIEAAKPTLLIDEADTFTKDNEELRGILNSGHTRASASIIRTAGDDHEPRQFSTWCPLVLAAIGSLPETVEDRSISIPMQRKAPNESVTPFPRSGKRAAALRAELHTLARKMRRWAADHGPALADADPTIPPGLHDRASDNWRPLLAIADAVGGEWPERARAAAVALNGGDSSDAESHRVRLLRDVRAIFEANGWDRVGSQTLCDTLVSLEEAPWAEYRKGKGLAPAQLARMLKPFGVKSRNIRLPDGTTPKGYYREAFEETFRRYLPSDQENSISERHTATSRAQSGDEPVFQNATPPPCGVSENATIPAPDAGCGAVADRNEESQDEEEICEGHHVPGSRQPAYQISIL
jgi:putative DNA primase/helicase